MKKCILIAAVFAMLTGCATTAVETDSGLAVTEVGGDGTTKQTTEFTDLPAEMQWAISEGS